MARDPKKLVILKALTDHLAGMKPTVEDLSGNPYEFDLTGRVHRNRGLFGRNDKVPFLSILEAPKPVEALTAGGQQARKEIFDLLLQGWADDDKDAPGDLSHQLAAQVQLRLGELIAKDDQGRPRRPDVHLLANRITSLTIGSSTVRPPQQGVSDMPFFYLPVTVEFTVNGTNPYA